MKNKITDDRNIKVSVVIPTHNCLDYLPEAIFSVRQQNVENYEIIVADDNSTDGTWNWLLEQQQTNPRIRPIKLNGVGPSKARNICISNSYGEFIAFLDADDSWTPEKLNAQIEFMDTHKNMAMSFTNYLHLDIEGKDLGTAFNYWPKFNQLANVTEGFHVLNEALPSIFAENVVGTSTVIARRNALQNANGYDEQLVSSEDWDLWLKLSSHGSVGYSNDVLMNYLMRPNSESSKYDKRINSLELIINRYQASVMKTDIQAVKTAHARLAVAKAEYWRMSNNYYRAFIQHLKAYKISPNHRTLRALLSDVINVLRMRKFLRPRFGKYRSP